MSALGSKATLNATYGMSALGRSGLQPTPGWLSAGRGILRVRTRSIWKLPVKRLSIFDAATQKVWPGRDCDILRYRLRQQTPKFWMMPAQVVPAAVAVSTDARPQSYYLGNQLFSGPAYNVSIHAMTTPERRH